ncbi:hypothetical protein TNCV_351211 [Trichonephila clavipes]|nr:hypothetical protein TNCV_351211 [Trichonephila clavipes]
MAFVITYSDFPKSNHWSTLGVAGACVVCTSYHIVQACTTYAPDESKKNDHDIMIDLIRQALDLAPLHDEIENFKTTAYETRIPNNVLQPKGCCEQSHLF